MALTMWSKPTGGRLERDELAEFRALAHRLYEANVHIFEDELDALSALGVVSLVDAPGGLDLLRP
ncbi:MAG: hypothetical protein AB7Q42_10935 [Acidimicrobiia bacterium]